MLSRTQILFAVWEYDADPPPNVIDVYVGYLRRKLGDPLADHHHARRGYRYRPSVAG